MTPLDAGARSLVVFALEISDLCERVAQRHDTEKTAAALLAITIAGRAIRACVQELRTLAAR